MEGFIKGQDKLDKEVIQAGWCVSCGMCVQICPYIMAIEDKIAAIHDCSLENENNSVKNCYQVCPRTKTDYNDLNEKMREAGSKFDPLLGNFLDIFQAKAIETSIMEAGQHGGVVTALTALSLEENIASAALLTDSSSFKPKPVLIRDKEKIMEASGSKFVTCPGIKALYEIDYNEKTIVVGRPCQVIGLRKLQFYTDIKNGNNVSLTIGLFCFWALKYSLYNFLEDKYGINSVTRMDLPRGKGLVIQTSGKEMYEIPLDDITNYIKTGCHSCFDPTSELADISIGHTRVDPQWNIVITRTNRGSELIKKAISKKIIETKPYPDKLKDQLKNAVKNKKIRVLKEKHDYAPINNSYLHIDGELRKKLLDLD